MHQLIEGMEKELEKEQGRVQMLRHSLSRAHCDVASVEAARLVTKRHRQEASHLQHDLAESDRILNTLRAQAGVRPHAAAVVDDALSDVQLQKHRIAGGLLELRMELNSARKALAEQESRS